MKRGIVSIPFRDGDNGVVNSTRPASLPRQKRIRDLARLAACPALPLAGARRGLASVFGTGLIDAWVRPQTSRASRGCTFKLPRVGAFLFAPRKVLARPLDGTRRRSKKFGNACLCVY